jgi:hypothetical protein
MKFKSDPAKETEKQRKERVALSGTTTTKVVPDKTKYNRNEKHKEKVFENFLDSLKGNGQDSLVEAARHGFRVCFESEYGEDKLVESDEEGIDYIYSSVESYPLLKEFSKLPEVNEEVMKEFKEKFNSEPEVASMRVGIKNVNPRYEPEDSSVGVRGGAYMEYDDAYLKVIFIDDNGNEIERQFPREYWQKVIKVKAPAIAEFSKKVYDNMYKKLDKIANGHYEGLALDKQINKYEDKMSRDD